VPLSPGLHKSAPEQSSDFMILMPGQSGNHRKVPVQKAKISSTFNFRKISEFSSEISAENTVKVTT
jgi:hypothetical protein